MEKCYCLGNVLVGVEKSWSQFILKLPLKAGGRWGEEITNVIKSKKVGLPKADFKIELQFFPEAVG